MVWTSAKKQISCFLLLCYFIISFYRKLIFNLHRQLILRISGITKICFIKTRPNVKFSLYLKKAGLAIRNIVHLQNIILRCVGFGYYIRHKATFEPVSSPLPGVQLVGANGERKYQGKVSCAIFCAALQLTGRLEGGKLIRRHWSYRLLFRQLTKLLWNMLGMITLKCIMIHSSFRKFFCITYN